MSEESQSLELIQAVATRDAKREDIVAALKATGVDALDVLVEVLASANARSPQSSPINILDSKRANRKTSISNHQVPHYAILHNGTLYDPQDIKRFDGQELHFIGGSPDSPILAIDDRDLIDIWMKYNYINSMAGAPVSLSASHMAPGLQGRDDGIATATTINPNTLAVPGVRFPSPDGPIGPHPTPGFSGAPRSIFFEDINYGGKSLDLARNRGYYDLTKVSWTFLGTGNWNDEISSFLTTIPLWTRLWENIHWTGSSYTVFGGSTNLVAVGWNDRASSLETW